MLWCSKCSKVLWATVFLEVVSKFTGRHSEFEHSKKLQCLTVKPFVSVFCCLCFLSIMNVESLEEGSHWLHIYIYISKIPIFAYINIDAFSKQTSCVASTMLASSRNVIIPTPPHPNPMTCVAPSMCASARNMMLRSTDHVCKFKERYHPQPTPTHPMTCVAPTMCASARNVTIPTPPHPNPMTCVALTMCASARNVIIPTPPHPNPMTCVAPTMCASARNMMLRSTDHVCKFKERYHPHPTPPQPIPWLA